MAFHAKLSPSSAKQWINCPPSIEMSKGFADTSGIAADEGTLAHTLGETMLRFELGFIDRWHYDLVLEYVTSHNLYHPEMWGYCEDYCNTVLSHVGPDSVVFIEKTVHFDKWVKQGSGTADAIILTPKFKKNGNVVWLLVFFDLKYGKGVAVSAIENEQLKCYALGIVQDFPEYDIENMILNIFQPRMNNNSDFPLTKEQLLFWAEDTLRPAALLAWEGEGELKVGDHCKFCKAKPRCPAMIEFVQETMRQDFANPRLLKDSAVISAFERIAIVNSWTKSVSDYVLAMALSGKKWKGYKLVEGKSNRVFKNEKTTEKLLLKAGYENIYTPVSLLGVTNLQKNIGTKAFREIVEPTLLKPKGAPTLVSESDSRKEFNSAKSDFEPVILPEDDIFN